MSVLANNREHIGEYNYPVHYLDIKSAYLNAPLPKGEEIYVFPCNDETTPSSMIDSQSTYGSPKYFRSPPNMSFTTDRAILTFTGKISSAAKHCLKGSQYDNLKINPARTTASKERKTTRVIQPKTHDEKPSDNERRICETHYSQLCSIWLHDQIKEVNAQLNKLESHWKSK